MKKTLLTVLIMTLLFVGTLLEAKNTFIESFTATWCGPCKLYDPIVNEMYDADPDLVLVHYHVQNDGFDSAWTNNRLNWYGNQGIPMFVFDGVSKKIGGSQSLYMQVRKMISDRKAQTGEPLVTLSLSYEEGVIKYQLFSPVKIDNAQIIVMLVEDQINDKNTILRNVVRAVRTYPFSSVEGSVENTVQFPMDPDWKREKLFGVVFLQKMSEKTVLSVGQTHRP